MTADRQEVKYRIDGPRIEDLGAALTRQLPSHRFTGDGANALPDPHSYATTVYFDTPSRSLFRAAVADPRHNVKLRVREYYDLHPSLVELATDPAQIVRYQPWVWFEMKAREGDRTTKRRVRLRKRELPGFLAAVSGGVDGAAADTDADAHAVQAIAEICRRLGEPLAASCLVNYRRLSWQTADGDLRVTLDRSLAFYAPPPNLWLREQTLLRSTLGAARGSEPGGLLEVKHRAALPPWIDVTLTAASARADAYSKFVAASRAMAAP